MVMFGGFGGRFDELMDAQNREADRRLHASKTRLLRGVANAVESQGTRKDLPIEHPLVRQLNSASDEEILAFRQALIARKNYLTENGAPIEAGLVGNAISDLDKGDYSSSRIEPYQTL